MDGMNTFGIFALLAGLLVTVVCSYVFYNKGKTAGSKETERAIRLDSLTSLRREIIEARQYFIDWFAPITTGTGWTADPDLSQEAGKKVDAIKTTCRAVQSHLHPTQAEAVGNLVRKLGSDYLEFAHVCKQQLPDAQRQKAEEMQRWFSGEFDNTLNRTLTEGRQGGS